MENFGEYITKEYGIAKRILKYLSLRDLLIARKVCRDWYKAVNFILINEFKRFPEVVFFGNSVVKKEEERFWKEATSVPEVIIKYYANGRHLRFSVSDDLLMWSRIFDCGTVEPDSLLVANEILERQQESSSCVATPTILLFKCSGCYAYSSEDRNGPRDSLHSSHFDCGGSSIISLPKSPGVYYYVFNVSLKDFKKSSFTLPELEKGREKGPIRCILVYESSNQTQIVKKFFQYLYNTVKGQQSTQFALGGGKVINMSSSNNCNQKTCELCGVVIRGENIEAYSDTLKYRYKIEEMDEFFSRVSSEVGTLPKGASRVALLAQCVDRPHTLKKIYPFSKTPPEILELDNFTKHFPDVPVCGFLAIGEFGLKADSNELIETGNYKPKKSRKNDFDLMHWQSTSIVLLTFLNSSK